MKVTRLLITATSALSILASSCSKDSGLTELPPLKETDDVCEQMRDIQFMAYCYQNFDVNGDGKVSMIEAQAVKAIECNDASDFTGIEYFSNLEKFTSHSAETVNLEYNNHLRQINCTNAPLSSIDLSHNFQLSEMSFENCKDLRSIIFSSRLINVSDNAFANCQALDTVICHASIPPILQNNAFYNIKSAILKVPEDAVEFYQYSQWAQFFDAIIPINQDIIESSNVTEYVSSVYYNFSCKQCSNFGIGFIFSDDYFWISENNQDWAKITKKKYEDDDGAYHIHILSLDENPSKNKRIASFITKSSSSDTQSRIVIVQYGNTTVSNPSIISTETYTGIPPYFAGDEYWGGVCDIIHNMIDEVSLLTGIYVENGIHNDVAINATNSDGGFMMNEDSSNSGSFILEYNYSRYYRVQYLPYGSNETDR